MGDSETKIYVSSGAKQWRTGLIAIGIGLFGLLPLRSVFSWLSGGPLPDSHALWTVALLVLLPVGLFRILNALRGLPRLTVTPHGITLDNGTKSYWAHWDSCEPFSLNTIYQSRLKKRAIASAKIIGPNASKTLSHWKTFVIPDNFVTPINTITEELNAMRSRALYLSAISPISKTESNEAPLGLSDFKVPWVTLALLILLIAIFALENLYSISPSAQLTPSVTTLLAMGGLSHAAIASGGEWYRLFTAPFLHADLAHILANGIALLWGGWFLERVVGRLWFLAIFVIGALGGSLLSLAIEAPNLVSVGASGALMAIFAAFFIASFHAAPGTSARLSLQTRSLQVLIPSLLPLFSSTSVGHIDYGAHFGGALSGAAVAALLLKSWSGTERVPRYRIAAAAIVAAGAILCIGSAGIAVANYPKYDVVLIPETERPKTAAELQARAAGLAMHYPGDPRSHLYLAQNLAAAGDGPGAERELRAALASAQAHSAVFGTKLESAIWVALGLSLAQQDKIDDSIAAYNEAIRLNSDSARAYNGRGLAYRKKEDYDQAIGSFDEAIKADPKFALAYTARGDTYSDKGNFERAIADYDDAIRLDSKKAFPYLSRGVAKLYAGTPKAVADFKQSNILDPRYPYTALWLDIVEKRSDMPSELSEAARQIDMSKWPAPVIRLYLGQMTPEAVLASADNPNAKIKKGQVCEANFYIGEWMLQQSPKDEATRLFRLAAAECPKTFIEWFAAKAELKALGAIP